MNRVIAVFGSSATEPGDTAYEVGVAMGRSLASSGFTVATGGYGGGGVRDQPGESREAISAKLANERGIPVYYRLEDVPGV